MSRNKNKIKMKRVNVCITEVEYITISDDADKTGLSISEILRRIIDEHYKDVINKNVPSQ